VYPFDPRSATAFRAPGLYVRYERDVPPEIPRTDVAAFIGIAERGPVNVPTRIESWTAFQATFGGRTSQAHLAYAVEGFFANGGAVCWIVRVADPDQLRTAELRLPDRAGGLMLEASSPGTWGDGIVVRRLPLTGEPFVLRIAGRDGTLEAFAGLTRATISERLGDPAFGSRLVRVSEDPSKAAVSPGAVPAPDLARGTPLMGGADGLATLRPGHMTGVGFDAPIGLRLLEDIREIGLVAMPDLVPTPPPVSNTIVPAPPDCCRPAEVTSTVRVPTTRAEPPRGFTSDEILDAQRALVGHCAWLHDRFAIVDAPAPRLEPNEPGALVTAIGNAFGALYYPWLRVAEGSLAGGATRLVPPSGHVAGMIARLDRTVGVQRPPANVPLEGVLDLSDDIDERLHGRFNGDGVNAIVARPGRGIRVMGARTTTAVDSAGGDRTRAPWAYVNVRRLITMIEVEVERATRWTVFEPNGQNLRREVDRAVRNFLDGLWVRGQLDGATAGDAYTVQCDDETTPPEEVDAGRVICLIGVAAPRPAEFVFLRLRLSRAGVEVLVEGGSGDG